MDQREAAIELDRLESERRLNILEEDLRAESQRSLVARIAQFETEKTNSLQQQVDSISRETKRQHGIISDLRATNKQLLEQIAVLQEEKERIGTQLAQANARARNLKKDIELHRRRVSPADHAAPPVAKKPPLDSEAPPKQRRAPTERGLSTTTFAAVFDMLASLFELSSRSFFDVEHLRAFIEPQQCIRVVPSLCDILPQLSSFPTRVVRNVLQFTHMCLCLLSESEVRAAAKTSLRRIGEEVYTPTGADGRQGRHVYFESDDADTRVLAVLIVLQSLTQGMRCSRHCSALRFCSGHCRPRIRHTALGRHKAGRQSGNRAVSRSVIV